MPDSPPERNTQRLNAALDHLKLGFSAFSVWSTTQEGTCKCPKGVNCTSPGKHPIPTNGFLAATADPVTLTTMMSAGSEPNYGIVWPEGGDVFIIDVDGSDWRERIANLKATYGALPPTKTTRTPSGGLHLFYRWPAGAPMPDGNDFHGFVVRYPWKGYVVGPQSRINGKVYEQVGPDQIATLPVAWVDDPGKAKPLIVVTDGPAPYEMPQSVATGHRHEEIAKLVASMWNRRAPMSIIEVLVRDLAERFDEPMDEARLKHEIAVAYSTAEKKWVTPAGGTREGTTSDETETQSPHQVTGREVIEVGLLDAPVAKPPISMRSEAFSTSAQIAELMDHWTPRTDAGYEGLLVTTLVYAGALLGHTPVAFYGSREQHANVFAVLVGTTGVSRKGTTGDLVRGIWRQVTDAADRLSHSANSGEGVIALAAKADGDPVLIVEEEFARFIAAKGRDGATLSPVLRQAFDDVVLSSVTATRNVRAENHHIAMIGHTTREELTETFSGVDLKNGFANRIAWTAVFQRPGAVVSIHDNTLPASLRDDLRAMLAWALAIPKPLIGGTTHQFSADARSLLLDASATYNTGVGLAPFLARRLDTIAARLSLIYACFDHSRLIEPLHVEAALAVTDYVRDTTAWLWPETTGDVRADFVLEHLRVAGFLNGTELEALIGTKKPLDKQQVFNKLALMGYARKAERPRRDGKPGRPQQGLELT
jgi:hypothetical protein